jgi:hypothetical protein
MPGRLLRPGICFAVLLLVACRPPVIASTREDDFSVGGRLDQVAAVDGVQRIAVRCYCFKRQLREVAGSREVVLRLSANWSSVGYHGRQEKPGHIPEALMRFRETRDGGVLTLESREYTFIHHAFLPSDLVIETPAGMPVTIEPVERSELEGRRVDP